MREVNVGQPLAAKAKGRQARCGVGEKSVFILSWGLHWCTKGSTGGGTPIGATRQKIVETMIGRSYCSQPLAAAYEARNVFITNLPEVFLLHIDKCTAKQLYQEWQQRKSSLARGNTEGHA